MTNQFNSFAPESKVWVYASDRLLTDREIIEIQTELDAFTSTWTAHSLHLNAKATIIENVFVVIMVDETQAQVSGCGIDKSVNFMQKLGSSLNLNFFNRLLVYIDTEDGIMIMPHLKVAEAIEQGKVHINSLIFNPLVRTKLEFETNWKIELKDSWLKTKLAKPI
jgi:hypothetical protein